MALSKLPEPNAERVEEITRRMKEIIETTWLRDPSMNDAEILEFQALKKEIEEMGPYVSYETKLNFDDPSNPKLQVRINVWIPKNTTIH